MAVVLVVEPEASQAEQLRRVLRKRVQSELLLVSSTAAAIDAMGRGIPDLILVSTLLSPRDEDRLMAHLRSLEGAAHLQTLTIPQLATGSRRAEETTVLGRFRKKKGAAPARAGCDPKVFAEEISVQLARALEIRKHPPVEQVFKPFVVEQPVEPIVEPIVEFTFEPSRSFDEVSPLLDDFTPAAADRSVMIEPDVEPTFRSAVIEPDPEPDFTSAIFESTIVESAAAPRVFEPVTEPDFTSGVFESALLESVAAPPVIEAIVEPTPPPSRGFRNASPNPAEFSRGTADRPAAIEPVVAPAVELEFLSAIIKPSVQPVSRPAVVQPDVEPDFMSALLESALLEVRAEPEPASKPAVVQSHAEPDFMASLLTIFKPSVKPVPPKPAEVREERQVDKPAVVESNVVAFRPAAVASHVEPAVASAAEEVVKEPDDLLERLARRFGFGSEMLKVADPDAPAARHTPILNSIFRRSDSIATAVNLEPEPEPVQDNPAERLTAQVAAVQAEAEATLAAELERVRAEGEARRLAELGRLQAEADIVRNAAIVEARSAAEREAREALAAELTRVRSEAEGVFAADLARVRAEVEEKLSAQLGAAETRLAVAERARSVAEAASAAALESEVARVRGEAEGRLQSELERLRKDAEAARIAEQSHAKHATQQIREAAAHEARTVAEQAAQRTLEAELVRVRVQADTFLETEVARVRAEAQERQTSELHELREQMAEIRETAARTAAEQSGAGDYYKIWQPRPVLIQKPQPVAEVQEEPLEPAQAGKYLYMVKWALPTAACFLLMLNNGIVIDTFASFVAPSPKKSLAPIHVVEPLNPPVVEKVSGALKVESTPLGAELLVDGRSYGKTPLTVPDLRPGVHTLVLRARGGSVTRRVTIRAGQTTSASEAIFSGWLAIFSAIPVDVSLNGKLAPANEDGRIMTAPGSYRVDLVNERFNYHVSQKLEVRPGEVTAHTVSIPKAAVRVVAPDGAEISVDGQPAGRAPLADLSIPIGTHEITATRSDLGARRTTIAVRYGEVTRAQLEFGR